MVENYVEKKVVGYADDWEGVGLRVQRAGVKKVSRSARKMNVGGDAVVLGGERSSAKNDDRPEDPDQLRRRPAHRVCMGTCQ